MVTSENCLKKYGAPEKESNMTVLQLPTPIILGTVIPLKIYCNKDMLIPLNLAIALLAQKDLLKEIKSWDGCFNIRPKKSNSSYSLHSWGIAVDINASTNQMGEKPTLKKEVVQCFLDAGFEWGGDWKTPDGMHLQLRKI